MLNNAAIYAGVTRSPFEDIDPAEWDLVMNVNLKGPWLVTRAASPYLPRGRTRHQPSQRHDLQRLRAVAALRRLQGRRGGPDPGDGQGTGPAGITVNAIAPGFTLTEASYGLMENAENYGVDRGAIKRASQPEDIVGAALFLAGPDSSYYTGQTMVVDGGRQFI